LSTYNESYPKKTISKRAERLKQIDFTKIYNASYFIMPDELDKDEGKKECIKYYNLRTNTTVTYADLKNKQPQKISESQIKRSDFQD